MGQAKQRRVQVERSKKFSKSIKRARFNLYTMGTRLSNVVGLCDEVSWWAS